MCWTFAKVDQWNEVALVVLRVRGRLFDCVKMHRKGRLLLMNRVQYIIFESLHPGPTLSRLFFYECTPVRSDRTNPTKRKLLKIANSILKGRGMTGLSECELRPVSIFVFDCRAQEMAKRQSLPSFFFSSLHLSGCIFETRLSLIDQATAPAFNIGIWEHA